MNKEIVSVSKSATKLKIVNNKIDSVFKASDTKTGLRVYDNGKIGISGVIGKADENELFKKAKGMLAFAIPYPVEPTKNAVRTLDLSNSFNLTDKQLADTTTELLNTLSQKYPDFSFSHEVQLINYAESLRNDCGTDLVCRDKFVQLVLLIKHKKSLNMMDGIVQNITRMYDFADAYTAATRTLDAFSVLADINEGETLPVIFGDDGPVSFLMQHLHGKMFAAGASVFSGKIGQKLFSDNFTFGINRTTKDTLNNFFDGEGTILANDKFPLIEKGIIRSPYTSKKIAKEGGFALTCSANLIYDAVPDVGAAALDITSSGKTLHELIGNQRAVLVEMASGGDFTAQGEYSTPVQVAYLWENGKIVGRLPQISVSSDAFKLFGNDFVGKATDGPYKNCPLFRYTVYNMKVNKIGGHI